MERVQQRQIVEALILASPEPVPVSRVAEIVPRADAKRVGELVRELNGEYAESGRAFEIWEVAGGLQIRTRADLAPYVKQLKAASPARLSRAALETLAVVAYRQPVTRAEVEKVRGVDAGPVLRSLLERRLLRIAGHRDVPGRPMIYATTRRFLEVFGLRSLRDLPALPDLDQAALALRDREDESQGGSEEAEPAWDADGEGTDEEAVSSEADELEERAETRDDRSRAGPGGAAS